jgi:hypothetical protein
MSYNPRGKVRNLLQLMQTQGRPSYPTDVMATMYGCPKQNLAAMMQVPRAHGVLHMTRDGKMAQWALGPAAEVHFEQNPDDTALRPEPGINGFHAALWHDGEVVMFNTGKTLDGKGVHLDVHMVDQLRTLLTGGARP